jgi:hypothetical protein
MDDYPYLVHVVTADGCRPAAVVRDQYHDGHMIDAYVLDEVPFYTPDVEHSPEGRVGTYHLAREHSAIAVQAKPEDAQAPTVSVTVTDVIGLNRQP